VITTFYSFKGGVGRSFALVETAAQLARRGHSVLVWDLDLEAPGLQRIPALQALEKSLKGGTLDLLDLFQKGDFDFEPVAKTLPDLIVDLEHAAIAETGGRLSFLLPGVLDDDYPKRFVGVDWPKLFAPEIGPGSAFFSGLAERLTGQLGYEHLLIDARTGYTDLGAVCAFELPDLLVLVLTLNAQNIAGIEPVWTAAVQRPSRHGGDYNGGKVPVLGVANLVPRDRAGRRSPLSRQRLEDLTQRGLAPRVELRLRPEHLVDDAVPSLTGRDDEATEWRPIAEEIAARAAEIARIGERDSEERRQRQLPERGPQEEEGGRRREVFERAKRFEEKVADLFRLLGYDVTLDYKRDDMQLDVRLEMPAAAIASYGRRKVTRGSAAAEHGKARGVRPAARALVARERKQWPLGRWPRHDWASRSSPSPDYSPPPCCDHRSARLAGRLCTTQSGSA